MVPEVLQRDTVEIIVSILFLVVVVTKLTSFCLEVVEEVDMETEEMEEIELSSDEEAEDDDDVALIVLKRPPVTERIIEEVEVRTM